MAQLLIRRLDDEVKERLRSRAKAHGVSMEEEARTILEKEVQGPKGLGSRIADQFRHIDWGDEELTPLPRQTIEPINFD
jgi:plasmid stability protein